LKQSKDTRFAALVALGLNACATVGNTTLSNEHRLSAECSEAQPLTDPTIMLVDCRFDNASRSSLNLTINSLSAKSSKGNPTIASVEKTQEFLQRYSSVQEKRPADYTALRTAGIVVAGSIGGSSSGSSSGAIALMTVAAAFAVTGSLAEKEQKPTPSKNSPAGFTQDFVIAGEASNSAYVVLEVVPSTTDASIEICLERPIKGCIDVPVATDIARRRIRPQ
jgi:hypothetical protein